jgi:hypothetical protein
MKKKRRGEKEKETTLYPRRTSVNELADTSLVCFAIAADLVMLPVSECCVQESKFCL